MLPKREGLVSRRIPHAIRPDRKAARAHAVSFEPVPFFVIGVPHCADFGDLIRLQCTSGVKRSAANGNYMTRLVGKRVTLREYFPSDAEDIYRWRIDGETTLWMGPRFRQPGSLGDVRERISKIIESPPEDTLFFAIAATDSLRYIGGIDLTSIDWIDKNAVLSLVIGSEADRNKGYATEAVHLLLRHAFRTMCLHRISLNVYERNEAALRCYLNAGFQVEGRRRDQTFVAGAYCDLIQMGILESEYSGE